MKPMLLDDKLVLSLTKAGERELREPGTALTPAQLEALVLIGDGAAVAQVIRRGGGKNPEALRASLGELIAMNLVGVNVALAADMIDAGTFFSRTESIATPEVDAQAQAEIDADTAFLQRNGYYVNMTRSLRNRRERSGDHKLLVLAVEDDPDISKVLEICFRLEGFDTHTAAGRSDVVAAFRAAPLPDLVLLDVKLKDVNGFDILYKMRQHPVLKYLPVIMVTAEATREAVLKGIVGGADGFITKPFQIENLVKAVRSVLGMQHGV
jgi:two-component system, OmpR family, response regulator